MGKHDSPVKHADAVRGLRAAGFVQLSQKSTSHTQWVLRDEHGNLKRKITLDEHNAPYTNTLLSSIARQAGMSKKKFLQLCSREGQKEVKRKGLLSFLSNQ